MSTSIDVILFPLISVREKATVAQANPTPSMDSSELEVWVTLSLLVTAESSIGLQFKLLRLRLNFRSIPYVEND
jgi:hypothetical protein